ncbi:MAG: MFS transporter [bacterium]
MDPTQSSDPIFPVNGYQKLKAGARDYLDHLRLFSRNARLYLVGSFLMGVNFQVGLVLLNLYFKEIGFMEGDIGYIASSRAIGMTLIAIPAGFLLSRVRLKPLLLISCVLFAVFSYFIVSLRTFQLLIGFAVLSGVAFSFYRVAAGPFYMRHSSPTERTHLFSFSFGTNMLAGIIGAAGAGRLATAIGEHTGGLIVGYQYTLYIGIVVSLLALIPFAMIKAAAPNKDEVGIKLSRESLRLRGGFYFKVFFCNFLIGMGAGLIIPFLNLYFRDRFDLPPDTIGLYYALVHLSMLIGSLSGPVLAKRFGLARTVVMTQLASLPFMAVLSYTYLLPLAVVAFVARGGLMNLGIPIVTNLSMELADENERGLVNALLMVGWTSSWMVSTAVGGRLIEAHGYTVTMNITIALYVISTLTFFLFFRKTESRASSGHGWEIDRKATI